jgi:hypothetical protein
VHAPAPGQQAKSSQLAPAGTHDPAFSHAKVPLLKGRHGYPVQHAVVEQSAPTVLWHVLDVPQMPLARHAEFSTPTQWSFAPLHELPVAS